MRPKPAQDSQAIAAYPSRRQFIRQFGLATVGAAVGVIAAGCDRLAKSPDDGPRLAGEIAVAPGTSAKVFCAETCGKEIDAQIKLLDDEDTKAREQAKAELIAIARAEGEDPSVVKQKQALVIARLEKLKAGEDKELALLATAIIQAIKSAESVVVPKGSLPLGGDPVR